MRLKRGGMDFFYIDESHDRHVFVVTAICVPFLRHADDQWEIVWKEYFKGAQDWRKDGANNLHVPITKELHGVKLAAGRGNYYKGKFSFDRPKSCSVYRRFLESVNFLPDASIISVAAFRGQALYGYDHLEAAMFALFQRMRRTCEARSVNAMTFFDQGHPEYRALYRKAQVYLPTGSSRGTWQSGDQSRNLPLDMFVEDENEKDSKHCFFTQLADLVAYSAFLKMKSEHNMLEDWQKQLSAGSIYDSIPERLLNKKVSRSGPQDAIVRLKSRRPPQGWPLLRLRSWTSRNSEEPPPMDRAICEFCIESRNH